MLKNIIKTFPATRSYVGQTSLYMQLFKETNDFLEHSSYFYTIAIGMDSKYSYVSNNYDKNFDLLKDSLLGKHFSITLHPDDISICNEIGLKCFKNPGELFSATLRKHDGKGGYVITQWEMKAMFDEDGSPDGIFCIGYNITEYVEIKTELVSAKTEIASKNDQLTEIGFLQSHVIRKPLANIMGLTNILSTMDINESFQNINDMMITSANELDSVIKSISNKTE